MQCPEGRSWRYISDRGVGTGLSDFKVDLVSEVMLGLRAAE